jgi:hypothetical protein
MRSVVLFLLLTPCARAQMGERTPVCEAASIKPTGRTDGSSRYNTDAGRMAGSNWTLLNYITFA